MSNSCHQPGKLGVRKGSLYTLLHVFLSLSQLIDDGKLWSAAASSYSFSEAVWQLWYWTIMSSSRVSRPVWNPTCFSSHWLTWVALLSVMFCECLQEKLQTQTRSDISTVRVKKKKTITCLIRVLKYAYSLDNSSYSSPVPCRPRSPVDRLKVVDKLVKKKNTYNFYLTFYKKDNPNLTLSVSTVQRKPDGVWSCDPSGLCSNTGSGFHEAEEGLLWRCFCIVVQTCSSTIFSNQCEKKTQRYNVALQSD